MSRLEPKWLDPKWLRIYIYICIYMYIYILLFVSDRFERPALHKPKKVVPATSSLDVQVVVDDAQVFEGQKLTPQDAEVTEEHGSGAPH